MQCDYTYGDKKRKNEIGTLIFSRNLDILQLLAMGILDFTRIQESKEAELLESYFYRQM